ncbi:MAG TPA: hypothetical protein VF365_09540, partial [Candidatus Limnocylindria bacterium]
DPPRLIVPCGGIRRAPVLERRVADAGPQHPPGGSATLAGLPGGRPATPRAPIGPAALLGLAAAALLGGALVGRRLGGGGGTDPDDEGTAEPSGADLESSPPALTLVPMPHERAP